MLCSNMLGTKCHPKYSKFTYRHVFLTPHSYDVQTPPARIKMFITSSIYCKSAGKVSQEEIPQ